MRIYTITPLGRSAARSTTAPPNDPKWLVLRYLDRVTRSTPDRIGAYSGASGGELGVALASLQRSRLIVDETASMGVN